MRRKRSKRPKKGILYFLRAMIVLTGLGILFVAVILIKTNAEHNKGDSTYEEVRQIFTDIEAEGNNLDQGDISSPNGFRGKDFQSLKEINEDIVAWIFAEGRTIDYPIVQGKDNSYYMRRMVNHEYNRLGTIFMDYRNQNDFSDKNTVIYGHNIKDGSMFALLTKYKDQDYYDNFPTMTLYTPKGDYTIEFFAGIIADGNYEFVRYKFADNEDFLDYVKSLEAESTFHGDIVIGADDRIVSLLTCSYEYNNARYALFGRLKPH